MGARSVGRECGLMILFGLEAHPGDASVAAREFFLHIAPASDLAPDEEARAYATEIAAGVAGDLAAIDELIRRASTNWRIERMSRVDRNVLRLGVWELMRDVPRAVVIDEAVELGKRFGTESSGSFVNGVLSQVADLIAKAAPPGPAAG